MHFKGYFVDIDLSLMRSDHKEGFVVASISAYQRRDQEAVTKNFREISATLGKKKRNVVKFCHVVGVSRLTKYIQASSELALGVFFSIKTRKHGLLFRAIVPVKDSWQRELVRFCSVTSRRLPSMILF